VNRCRIVIDEIASTDLLGALSAITDERASQMASRGDHILIMNGDAAQGRRVCVGVWMLIRNDRIGQAVYGAPRKERPKQGPSITKDGWVSPDLAKWEAG
jgi:hypothetical protein